MSDEIALDLTRDDGSIDQKLVSIADTDLYLNDQQLVGISSSIMQLTRLVELGLWNNAFTEIPSAVLAMTQLTGLDFNGNSLVAIPREICHWKVMTLLFVCDNKLTALPREVGQLLALEHFDVRGNALTSLPAELGQLSSLQTLELQGNSLTWLPLSLDRLPATTKIFLNGNPLPIDVGPADGHAINSRPRLPKTFAATTALSMIRSNATTLCIGLQDLSLPALVTLEIIDAAFPNSIPMHLKWNLITAVKHFH